MFNQGFDGATYQYTQTRCLGLLGFSHNISHHTTFLYKRVLTNFSLHPISLQTTKVNNFALLTRDFPEMA